MGAHRIAAAGPAGHVHTAGNAVPSLSDDTEDLLESLSGIHAGLDQIRAGFRLIMTDRLTRGETQTLMGALAGDSDGNDVLRLIASAVARLADFEANPCLRDLEHDTAMDVRRIGAAVAVDLDTTGPRDLTAAAAGRVDPYAEPADGGAAPMEPDGQSGEADLAEMHATYERMDQAEYTEFMDGLDARDAAAAELDGGQQ